MKQASSVLIVDDDVYVRAALERHLTAAGFRTRQAGNVAEAIETLTRAPVDVALVDFMMPDGTGAEVISWALSHNAAGVAYCMTAVATCQHVVEAMRAGAADVLEKPFDMERLKARLAASAAATPNDLQDWRRRFAPGIMGDDPQIQEALEILRSVADTDSTVLITGESGTGKELAGHALHEGSSRRDRPFVALNCAAIPEALLESELFGHVRGAFTGAVAAREGKIAAAAGGTLFLDEIGDMPVAAQAKLLRVLQERCVTPVGSDRPVPVDVRIVAATNKDLEAMVEEGSFRDDLYYRLGVIHVALPALRERAGDILPLARFFLYQANQQANRAVQGFDASAEQALLEHGWPGNVRELANTVERAVVLKGRGHLSAKDLRIVARRLAKGTRRNLKPVEAELRPRDDRAREETLNLKSAIDTVERELIQQALERTGGNRTEAAALLGLNRTTLVEKIRKYGE